MALDEIYRVGEKLYAGSTHFFQIIQLIVSSILLFSPGPIRVVGEMIICFRVRHETKYATGRITDSGYIAN